MRGTEEKGVDTHIATAMISLAWTDNYDAAVLVFSDQDFIPVVDFLNNQGHQGRAWSVSACSSQSDDKVLGVDRTS